MKFKKRHDTAKEVSTGNSLDQGLSLEVGFDEVDYQEIASKLPENAPSEFKVALELAHALTAGDSGFHGLSTAFPNGRPGGFDAGYGNNDLNKIATNLRPKKRMDKTRKALKYAEEDDLVIKLMDFKVFCSIAGFTLRCRPQEGIVLEDIIAAVMQGNSEPEESDESDESIEARMEGHIKELTNSQLESLLEQVRFQRKLNDFSMEQDLYGIVSNLFRDWFVTDNMILYWRTDGSEGMQGEDSSPGTSRFMPNLVDICVLSPAEVDWDNSLGRDVLRYVIPRDLKETVNRQIRRHKVGPARQEAKERLAETGIPLRWINAIEKNATFIDLKREEGDNWIIKTKARKHHGLAPPSMYSIFFPLETRESLAQGEFSAGYLMKHFIMHVTMGESITQGPLAGQRTNWATPNEIGGMFKLVATVQKAIRLVTNHTVKFNFVIPPKEMFDPERYNSVNKRIHSWSDVAEVIMTGEGSNFSGGYISIKRLQASIGDSRKNVEYVATTFFNHPTVRDSLEVPDNCSVIVRFDENVLKEPAQLLNEVKFMVEEGIGDPRTAMRELGRDPDSVRMSKLETMLDNVVTRVYEKLSESGKKNGGGGGQEAPGRPAREDTVRSEETRTQPPAVS